MSDLALSLGGGQPALAAPDLAGFNGLEELALSWPISRLLPDDLLRHTPRLLSLHLELYFLDLPDPLLVRWTGVAVTEDLDRPVPLPRHLLASSPRLRRLTLQVTGAPPEITGGLTVPANWLDHTPELRALNIHLPRGWGQYGGVGLSLPARFLVRNAHLQSLSLQASYIKGWSDNFLNHNAQLQHLSLSPIDMALPPDFLAANPALEKVSLHFTPWISRQGPPFLAAAFVHNPQLREVVIEADEWLHHLPADAFAHNPRLEHLKLVSNSVPSLPSGLLAGDPHLKSAHFHLADVTGLPPDLFVHNPDLRQVVLVTGMDTNALFPELFAHNPQLRSLTLHGARLRTVPTDLLANNPRLRSLTLYGSFLGSLPPELLSQQAHLQRLQLEAEHLAFVPDKFLASSPQLQHLVLQVGRDTVLPADLLRYTRQLRSLHWAGGRGRLLPRDFLIHAPELTALELEMPLASIGDQALAADLLAHNPQLRRFRLYAHALVDLPADLLAHNPQLQHLTLSAHQLAELPPDLLAHNPRLQSLTLALNNLTSLPAGFLAHNPELQALAIYSLYSPDTELRLHSLSALPGDFLRHNPQLQHLRLDIFSLTALPNRFLASNLHLRELTLQNTSLRDLPTDFLAHHPRLLDVTLSNSELSGAPPGFLTQSRHLRRARIFYKDGRCWIPRSCEREYSMAWWGIEAAETE